MKFLMVTIILYYNNNFGSGKGKIELKHQKLSTYFELGFTFEFTSS